MTERDLVIDLFAGMGGWSCAAAARDLDEIGIEYDEMACRTATVNGHRRLMADVSTFPLEQLAGRVVGIIASPPCTDWSQSGKRQGLDGETGALVLEVDRWVRALDPVWVACEQVPPALQWWNRFAHEWAEHLGYSTWSGVLNSANYGVPQTRERAILIASRERRVGPPPATHDRSPAPSLFGDEMLPWVSMARALGWDGFSFGDVVQAHGAVRDDSEPAPTITSSADNGNFQFRVGFPRLDDRGDSPDGYRERDWRDGDDPAFTVTEKARSWIVQTGNPSSSRVRDYPEGERPHADDIQYQRDVERPAPTLNTRADLWQIKPGDEPLVVQTGNNSHVTSREGSKAGEGGVEKYERSIDEPAPTLDTQVGSKWRVQMSRSDRFQIKPGEHVVGVNTGRDWKPGGTREDAQVVPADDPAPTIDGKGRWHALLEEQPWIEERPATTIQGDPRVWPPGHKINADDERRLGADEAAARYGDRAGSTAIRLGIADALILQSFDPDYIVVGNKSKQFEQVGNAIPPLLAWHVLGQVVGDDE